MSIDVLCKAGIPSIVFEKHVSLTAQPRDWNMGMHWGTSALRGLLNDSIWERIRAVQVDPSSPVVEHDELRFTNARSGELLSALPVQRFYRLRRVKLRTLLSEGLDIRYGKHLVNVEYSRNENIVTLFFNDGSAASGRLVIGADGAHSTTRQHLLGSSLGSIRHLPYVATFIQAKFTAKQALYLRQFHPLYLPGVHPSGYFCFFGMQDVEDPRKPETWTFFFYISWKSSLEEQAKTASWSNRQRLQQVKAMAEDFCDPWKSAFAWVKDNHQVWHMGLTDFDPGSDGHRWNNHDGRITLAGDAAHAMTYQRGQGLNHSVTDAAEVVGAVKSFYSGREFQQTAINAYENKMIARAGAEVRLSTTNTEMLHDWRKVLASPVMTSGMRQKHEIMAN